MKFVASPAVDRPNRRTTGFSSRPPPLCRFARVTAKSAALKAADAVNKATFCLSQNRCSLTTGAASCGGPGRMTGDAASSDRLGVAEGASGSAPTAGPSAQRAGPEAPHMTKATATKRRYLCSQREVIGARQVRRSTQAGATGHPCARYYNCGKLFGISRLTLLSHENRRRMCSLLRSSLGLYPQKLCWSRDLAVRVRSEAYFL